MAQLRDKRELLYLQKDASGVVSVPCTGLAQHQIDGVRFLFKQYRKLNPGVIISYPSGCGSSVQVGTFISAIYTQLDKPILILYDKDREREAWLKMFSNWTDIPRDAIAVDSPSIFIRNLIHIANISEELKLCGRKWNIVVIKTDEINKMLLKLPLVADFKIWVTSIDMKKNREMFNTLYTRIYGSTDIQLTNYLKKFTGKEKALLNSLLPNAFYEDCLWINRELLPFARRKLPSETENKIVSRVSKKNKDATGKKIKRSKKSQEASASTVCDRFDTPTDDAQDFNIENNTTSKINDTDDKNDDKMDVESFIRDNEPLKRDNVFQSSSDQVNSITDNVFVTGSVQMNPEGDNEFKIDLDQVNLKRGNVLQTGSDQLNSKNNSVFKTSSVQVNPLTEEMDSDQFNTEQVNFSAAIDDIVRIENDINVEIAEDLVEAEENASVVMAEGIPTTVNDDINNTKTNGKAKSSIMKQTDIFDSKLKKVEELALKKFKGTLLDKMF